MKNNGSDHSNEKVKKDNIELSKRVKDLEKKLNSNQESLERAQSMVEQLAASNKKFGASYNEFNKKLKKLEPQMIVAFDALNDVISYLSTKSPEISKALATAKEAVERIVKIKDE